MIDLTSVGLTNAALATALAALLWLSLLVLPRGRLGSPHVVRLLAVMILLRFVAPPLLPLQLLPSMAAGVDATRPWAAPRQVSAGDMDAAAAGSQLETYGDPDPARAGAPLDERGGATFSAAVRRVVSLVWASGMFLVAAVWIVAERRFRLSLRLATRPTDRLAARIEALARRVGLAATPATLVVRGSQPPLVVRRRRSDLLVLPASVIEDLDPDELDAVIVHELSHLKRRDGIVRWLEAAACCAFWWNPAVWWTRRCLRSAEEACCDQLVLRFLPGKGQAYAEAILKTLESTRARGVPMAAAAMSSVHRLEERLRMILDSSSRPQRRWLTAAVLVLGLGVVGVFPTFSQLQPEDEAREQAEHDLALRELELEELDLDVEARRIELQLRMEAAEADGQERRLDLVEERLASMRTYAQSDEERRSVEEEELLLQTEREQMAVARELQERGMAEIHRKELAMRRVHLDARRLALEGREAAAREKAAAAAVLEDRLLEDRLTFEVRQAELEESRTERRLDELRGEVAQLQARGETEEADRLERVGSRQREQIDLDRARRDLMRREVEVERRTRQAAREMRDRDLRDRERHSREDSERMARELDVRRRAEARSLRARAAEIESRQIRLEVDEQVERLRALFEELGDDGGASAELSDLQERLSRLLDQKAQRESAR